MDEEWYAIAGSPLSSVTITLHYTGETINEGSAIAFGVSGADLTQPFDPAAQLPATASGIYEVNPEITVTLSKHSYDLVFMLLSENSFVIENGGGPGKCCAKIQSQFGALAEYEIVKRATNNLSVISSNPHGWSAIVDAIAPIHLGQN